MYTRDIDLEVVAKRSELFQKSKSELRKQCLQLGVKCPVGLGKESLLRIIATGSVLTQPSPEAG